MGTYALLIGGRLVDGAMTMDVVNPATEAVLATCPRASLSQLNEAVAAAKSAFPAWAATPIDERRRVLRAIADRVEAHADELGRILTQEQGKPLANATGEIRGTARRLRYFADQPLEIEILEATETRRVELHRMPLGVVAAIVPWNFPIAMMSWKLAPALLAGNSVVIKPAPTTPLTTLRFGELVMDVVPPGVINIITDDNDLGAALTGHPDISKISFTGSVATGRRVMASAAPGLKHLTLELGGNDAAIVLDDVDPKAIAQSLYDKAFSNGGQVCIAIKRLFVHETIYDAVCTELARIADSAIVGDGLEQGTQIGPVQNRRQFERVKELLAEARAAGQVITVAADHSQRGFFLRPTIVRDVAEGIRLVDEEQFGPVLPVMKFSTDEEALSRANASSYGLGGSVWSADAARAYALATRLEAGMVWVNKHADAADHIPFGGAKQSGLGWELGREGLHAYTQMKVVNVAL